MPAGVPPVPTFSSFFRMAERTISYSRVDQLDVGFQFHISLVSQDYCSFSTIEHTEFWLFDILILERDVVIDAYLVL